LRENYGVNSIEEYEAKLEQEAWLNYSQQMEALASEYPELNLPQNYMQAGTSAYQPPTLKSEQSFYAVVLGEPVVSLQVFSLSGLGLLGLAAVPPVKKRKQLRQALILGIVVLCVFSVGYFVGLTAAQTGTITIEPNSFQTEASYIIFKDGTTIKARNGKTGQIDFSGTDANTVIQLALNSLTSGRTWKEKVVIKGYFDNLDQIVLPSYVTLEVQGVLKAKANIGYAKHFIYAYNQTMIEICGGIIDGNMENQANSMDTICFEYVTNSSVHDCFIYNGRRVPAEAVYGEGLALHYCNYVDIHDNIFAAKSATVRGYDMIKVRLYSAYCTIRGNIITFLSGAGYSLAIQLASNANHNVVMGNTIYSNEAGIKIDSGYENVVVGNAICARCYTENAIELVGNAARNIIAENCITSDSGSYPLKAILMEAVSGETQYDNMILNNLIQLNNVANAVGITCYNPNGTYRRAIIRGNKILGGTASDIGIQLQNSSYDFIIEDNDLTSAALDTKIALAGSGHRIRNNSGYTTENSGTATFSGDGSTTTFTIAHGLAGTPKMAIVTAGSNDAKGNFYVTYDNTNIYVTYATAPPSGTNNVVLRWYAEM
jgi:parallel beta-helix repeat protein